MRLWFTRCSLNSSLFDLKGRREWSNYQEPEPRKCERATMQVPSVWLKCQRGPLSRTAVFVPLVVRRFYAKELAISGKPNLCSETQQIPCESFHPGRSRCDYKCSSTILGAKTNKYYLDKGAQYYGIISHPERCQAGSSSPDKKTPTPEEIIQQGSGRQTNLAKKTDEMRNLFLSENGNSLSQEHNIDTFHKLHRPMQEILKAQQLEDETLGETKEKCRPFPSYNLDNLSTAQSTLLNSSFMRVHTEIYSHKDPHQHEFALLSSSWEIFDITATLPATKSWRFCPCRRYLRSWRFKR